MRGEERTCPARHDLVAELPRPRSVALAAARGLGLKVIPWTVNEPADIARVLAMNVDGLISDYPDRVRQALGR